MLYVIIAILVIILINLKELLAANPRGRIMGIYFTLMGISLLLGIMMSIGSRPPSPNMVIANMIRLLGFGE